MASWGTARPRAAAARATADAIVAPADAVAATKAYLRIESGDEDALIGRLVAAAIGHGEDFTGQALLARGFAQQVEADGGWQRLARGPVTAIAAAGFAVDIDAAGDGWVRAAAGARAAVQFTAGMATGWAGLPEPIAQGVVRLAAHLFAHRDGDDPAMPPAAVVALWRPWRRIGL